MDSSAVPSQMDSLRDCCLITKDGKRFMIHRAILCHCSQYFTDLFCGDVSRDKKEVHITEISGDTMKDILNFIYSGNIYVNEKNICDILKAADRLSLKNLLAKFTGFMMQNISISNCVQLVNLTSAMSYLKMYPFCLNFLKANFDNVVFESNDFLQLSSVNWINLLNDNSSSVIDVRLIWKNVVKWFQADMNRLTFLPEFLRCLIPICNSINKEYAAIILRNPIVIAHDKYDAILQEKNKISDTVNPSQLFPLCIIGNSPSRKNLNGLVIMHKTPEGNSHSDYIPYAAYITKDVLYLFNRDYDYSSRSLYAAKVTASENKEKLVTHIKANSVSHMGSEIYLFGGSEKHKPNATVRAFDTDTEIWHEKPTMPFILKDISTESLNGKIYLIGSKISSDDKNVSSENLWGLVYDSLQEEWSFTAVPSVDRKDFLLVSHCGCLYFIGGTHNDIFVRTVERYDESLDLWITCGELPYDFVKPRAVAFGNLLVVYEDVLQCTLPRNIGDPVYLNPVSSKWVVFPEKLFLEMLTKFSVCVLKLLPTYWK